MYKANSQVLSQATYIEPSIVAEVPKNNFWYIFNESPTVMVFVHGIFSNSRDCWLLKDSKAEKCVFWPDLISQDKRLGSPSIYLAGYHTKIDADYPISQCAREVFDNLGLIDADGTPPVLEKQNIVFVCHSAGGLVVRYLIERHQDVFRDKGIGVALIASPSLGSAWANILSLAAWYYNQRLGLQLREGSGEIEDILGRFRDLVDRKGTKMPKLFGMEACENKMILRDQIPSWIRWALPNKLRVVDHISAGQHFGEVKYLPDTDHFSAVKPDGMHHPAHEFIVTFMKRFQKEILAHP